MCAPNEFCFLNTRGVIDDASGWDDARFSRLWRYNLHYFDDLNASDAPDRRHWHERLIERWITDNPPVTGTAWEPYPTALRAVNWIKWAVSGNRLSAKARGSLAMQLSWLERRLETHLLGNHLWSNGKALLFGAGFFKGRAAERWRRIGERIIARQFAEQLLRDGGHFERSPMYHAMFVEDALDLINLNRLYPDVLNAETSSTIRTALPRMIRWLAVMSHPDGEIGFFNDAAFSIGPNVDALVRYADRLDIHNVTWCAERSLEKLPDSGYFRISRRRANLICDVAPIGPDYLPGHGHADTLSFELSLDGTRVIVNGGTSLYDAGPERQRQRGTAAHSTVVVDGRDSSEVWAAFRVGRRARPLGVRWEEAEDVSWVEAGHDGFARLWREVVHWRRWELKDGQLIVADRIDGEFKNAVSWFHLSPAVSAQSFGDRTIELRVKGFGSVTLEYEGTASVELVGSTWHPEFGLSVPTTSLRATFGQRSIIARFTWEVA